ncbi:hypothetical protein [Streptomyces sp. NRRL S-31]|uniref:hypothetical protein n=1 Tax=Streptomyces sp. NRRL S-31 TaxID=1463898 RepID=UPI0004C5EC28|nr:hypothetical protein [Streptomyces sp. NRRL S-31]
MQQTGVRLLYGAAADLIGQPPVGVVKFPAFLVDFEAFHGFAQGVCLGRPRLMRAGVAVGEEDALRQRVPACVHCRPDTALGTHS